MLGRQSVLWLDKAAIHQPCGAMSRQEWSSGIKLC